MMREQTAPHFDITMTGGAHYKVVVYRDLQNVMKVTSYEKVG